MTRNEVLVTLKQLADDRQTLIDSVNKMGWRPSEKAMAAAKYRIQQEALDYAIGALRALTVVEKGPSAVRRRLNELEA